MELEFPEMRNRVRILGIFEANFEISLRLGLGTPT